MLMLIYAGRISSIFIANESHQILITHTVDVSHATKSADDTAASYVATTFPSEGHRRLALSDTSLGRYRLARLSKVEEQEMRSFFDAHGGGLREVPSVMRIGDGSYEIVLLNSHCDTLISRLDTLLPNSQFGLEYDPTQPTEADLTTGEYGRAKATREQGFFQRAVCQIREGQSTAAACYA